MALPCNPGTQIPVSDIVNGINVNELYMENHILDKNNPHSVTATQVGAEPAFGLGTAGQVLTTNNAVDGKEWKSVLTGYKNLLINGGFDIWERGESFADTAGYTADRWVVSDIISCNKVDPTPTDKKTYIAIDSTFPDVKMIQYIEDGYKLQGKTVTISFWLKDPVNCQEGHIRYRYENTFTEYTFSGIDFTTPGYKSLTFHMEDDQITSGYLELQIVLCVTPADTSAKIAEVQFELGDTATNFEQRPIALERSLCQRYYWTGKVNGKGSGVKYMEGSENYAFAGSLTFPTEMRTIPTITTIEEPIFENCTFADFSYTRHGFIIRAKTTESIKYRIREGKYAADAEIYP